MAAYIISGEPGAGKTYTGTAFAIEALSRGYRVAINWDMECPEGAAYQDARTEDPEGRKRQPLSMKELNALDGPLLIRYDEHQDVIGLEDALVLNDEAQATAGARDWETMSKRTRLWLSMHRHYRVTLVFLTQHYKFVDVYYRRLAVGGAMSLSRFFNLSLLFPRPQADAELGTLGVPDLLAVKAVWRPWKHLDFAWAFPTFRRLWRASRQVPAHYRTHQPRDKKDENPKKTPERGGPAAPEPTAPTKKQVPLL